VAHGKPELARDRLREVSTFNAVEFSKTEPPSLQTLERQQKSLRLAPEALGEVIRGRIRSLEGTPVVE